jgi:hypothetical protein
MRLDILEGVYKFGKNLICHAERSDSAVFAKRLRSRLRLRQEKEKHL